MTSRQFYYGLYRRGEAPFYHTYHTQKDSWGKAEKELEKEEQIHKDRLYQQFFITKKSVYEKQGDFPLSVKGEDLWRLRDLLTSLNEMVGENTKLQHIIKSNIDQKTSWYQREFTDIEWKRCKWESNFAQRMESKISSGNEPSKKKLTNYIRNIQTEKRWKIFVSNLRWELLEPRTNSHIQAFLYMWEYPDVNWSRIKIRKSTDNEVHDEIDSMGVQVLHTGGEIVSTTLGRFKNSLKSIFSNHYLRWLGFQHMVDVVRKNLGLLLDSLGTGEEEKIIGKVPWEILIWPAEVSTPEEAEKVIISLVPVALQLANWLQHLYPWLWPQFINKATTIGSLKRKEKNYKWMQDNWTHNKKDVDPLLTEKRIYSLPKAQYTLLQHDYKEWCEAKELIKDLEALDPNHIQIVLKNFERLDIHSLDNYATYYSQRPGDLCTQNYNGIQNWINRSFRVQKSVFQKFLELKKPVEDSDSDVIDEKSEDHDEESGEGGDEEDDEDEDEEDEGEEDGEEDDEEEELDEEELDEEDFVDDEDLDDSEYQNEEDSGSEDEEEMRDDTNMITGILFALKDQEEKIQFAIKGTQDEKVIYKISTDITIKIDDDYDEDYEDSRNIIENLNQLRDPVAYEDMYRCTLELDDKKKVVSIKEFKVNRVQSIKGEVEQFDDGHYLITDEDNQDIYIITDPKDTEIVRKIWETTNEENMLEVTGQNLFGYNQDGQIELMNISKVRLIILTQETWIPAWPREKAFFNFLEEIEVTNSSEMTEELEELSDDEGVDPRTIEELTQEMQIDRVRALFPRQKHRVLPVRVYWTQLYQETFSYYHQFVKSQQKSRFHQNGIEARILEIVKEEKQLRKYLDEALYDAERKYISSEYEAKTELEKVKEGLYQHFLLKELHTLQMKLSRTLTHYQKGYLRVFVFLIKRFEANNFQKDFRDTTRNWYVRSLRIVAEDLRCEQLFQQMFEGRSEGENVVAPRSCVYWHDQLVLWYSKLFPQSTKAVFVDRFLKIASASQKKAYTKKTLLQFRLDSHFVRSELVKKNTRKIDYSDYKEIPQDYRQDPVTLIHFCTRGTFLLSCHKGKVLTVWNTCSGAILAQQELEDKTLEEFHSETKLDSFFEKGVYAVGRFQHSKDPVVFLIKIINDNDEDLRTWKIDVKLTSDKPKGEIKAEERIDHWSLKLCQELHAQNDNSSDLANLWKKDIGTSDQPTKITCESFFPRRKQVAIGRQNGAVEIWSFGDKLKTTGGARPKAPHRLFGFESHLRRQTLNRNLLLKIHRVFDTPSQNLLVKRFLDLQLLECFELGGRLSYILAPVRTDKKDWKTSFAKMMQIEEEKMNPTKELKLALNNKPGDTSLREECQEQIKEGFQLFSSYVHYVAKDSAGKFEALLLSAHANFQFDDFATKYEQFKLNNSQKKDVPIPWYLDVPIPLYLDEFNLNKDSTRQLNWTPGTIGSIMQNYLIQTSSKSTEISAIYSLIEKTDLANNEKKWQKQFKKELLGFCKAFKNYFLQTFAKKMSTDKTWFGSVNTSIMEKSENYNITIDILGLQVTFKSQTIRFKVVEKNSVSKNLHSHFPLDDHFQQQTTDASEATTPKSNTNKFFQTLLLIYLQKTNQTYGSDIKDLSTTELFWRLRNDVQRDISRKGGTP